MSKTERVNLAIDPVMLNQLNQTAKDFGLGKSEMIRDGILLKIRQLKGDSNERS